MVPDKDKERKGGGDEFEVAYYTKELGRPLQRKLLQKRLALLSRKSDSPQSAPSHGEEPSPEWNYLPPREDRAG